MRRIIVAAAVISASAICFHSTPAAAQEAGGTASTADLCSAAEESTESDAIQGMLDQAREEGLETEEKLKEAIAKLANASAQLVRAGFVHHLDLTGRVEEARQRLAGLEAEHGALVNQMMTTEGEARQQLSEQRTALLQEISNAEAAVASAIAARDNFGDLLSASQGDALSQAASLFNAFKAAATSDLTSLAGPISEWKAANDAVDAAKAEADAATTSTECIEQRMATILELEDAAATLQVNLVQQLGDEMQAKRREIQVRQEAVRTAWAASGQLDGGPEVLRLTEEYFRTINEYIEIGTQFEQAMQGFQEKGGVVEDWMTDLVGHLAHVRQELAEWQAKQ